MALGMFFCQRSGDDTIGSRCGIGLACPAGNAALCSYPSPLGTRKSLQLKEQAWRKEPVPGLASSSTGVPWDTCREM